jgi:hypothetical protein
VALQCSEREIERAVWPEFGYVEAKDEDSIPFLIDKKICSLQNSDFLNFDR